MLDSTAICCKPSNGKDSYYVFDPLALRENKDEDMDSGTECTKMLEPNDIDTSEKNNESSYKVRYKRQTTATE